MKLIEVMCKGRPLFYHRVDPVMHQAFFKGDARALNKVAPSLGKQDKQTVFKRKLGLYTER
jgi:hypothetical protein